MQFLYLPVSRVAGNFPAIAASSCANAAAPACDGGRPEVVEVLEEELHSVGLEG